MVDQGDNRQNIETAGSVFIGANTKIDKKKIDTEAYRKKDAMLVKGRFNYHEVSGGTLRFVYRAYKGDPVMKYELQDGQIYKLPRGVARHLNENVGRKEHKYLLDKHGNPSTLASVNVRRCSFENLEFVDYDDIGNTHIEEVTVTELPPLSKKR